MKCPKCGCKFPVEGEEEVLIRMSKNKKGKTQEKIQCPYCKKEGGTTMYRWHFENCKEKGFKNGEC